MEKIESVFKKHPFFQSLKAEYIADLIKHTSSATFKEGETIFQEGKEVDNLYIITDGLVALEIFNVSQSYIIETLQKGDILGWSWLIPPYQAKFNCRAVKTTHVIALNGKHLRELCAANHDVGYELVSRLIRVVTHRLEATRHQLINAIYGA